MQEPTSSVYRARLAVAEQAVSQGDSRRAEAIYREVLDRCPAHGPAMERLGRLFYASGRLREAAGIFRKLIAFEPDDLVAPSISQRGRATLYASAGHGLRAMGFATETATAYRRSLQCDRNWGDIYWYLADVDPKGLTKAEMVHVEKRLQSNHVGSDPSDAGLWFALARARELRQRYGTAFSAYLAGNDIKKAEYRYHPEDIEGLVARQIEFFTAQRMECLSSHAAAEPRAVFICGLPRSGTSLVEQILNAHSAVTARGELPLIPNVIGNLIAGVPGRDAAAYPNILSSLPAEFIAQIGPEYIRRAAMDTGVTPLFTDKLPQNLFNIGFIRVVFPGARIIHVRRHPLDLCCGCFRQLFQHGQQFSYDLDHLARYYCACERMMDHWKRLFPGEIHTVRYESLIEDPRTQVVELLNYLGLDWEDSCARFYQQENLVVTASATQVRKPLHSGSVGVWRHYEEHLAGLRQALAEHIAAYSS